jgi:hypothetical protein
MIAVLLASCDSPALDSGSNRWSDPWSVHNSLPPTGFPHKGTGIWGFAVGIPACLEFHPPCLTALPPLLGARVETRRGTRTWTSRVRGGGYFLLHVPPGKYTVRVDARGRPALQATNCRTRGVYVRKGRYSQLDLSCDVE